MSDAVPAWLTTARILKGTLEAPGAVDNPAIMDWPRQIAARWPEMSDYTRGYTHDSIAWCGLFVAYCVSASGIRPPFGSTDTDKFLWANAWSRWGTKLDAPKLGCVMVFTRNGGGHVAFYESEDDDYYYVTGGNQSDSVSTTRMAKGQFSAAVWPPAAEKLPAAGNIAAPEGWSGCGKGSWYSQYQGKYSWVDKGDQPNSNALGVPDDQQGCAFYDHSTLGKWFDVQAPNERVLRIRQTDIGPHPRTGRKIDIAAVAAERFGYAPTNFPTDGIFRWRPAVADTAPVPTPEVTPTPQIPVDDFAQKFKAYKAAHPEEFAQARQSVGTLLMIGIKAAMVAFPQFAIFGSLAQFMLSAAGFMGTPIGEAATTTGQVTGATLVSLLASWAVSKINKVAR